LECSRARKSYFHFDQKHSKDCKPQVGKSLRANRAQTHTNGSTNMDRESQSLAINYIVLVLLLCVLWILYTNVSRIKLKDLPPQQSERFSGAPEFWSIKTRTLDRQTAQINLFASRVECDSLCLVTHLIRFTCSMINQTR
jgi:fucose 4-O-acetylase-like acetyltransferase